MCGFPELRCLEEEEQRCWHVLDPVESWFHGLLQEPRGRRDGCGWGFEEAEQAEQAEQGEGEDSFAEFNSFGEDLGEQSGAGGALALRRLGAFCAALDRSLAEAKEALKAHEAKAKAVEAQSCEETESFGEQLDQLLARYEEDVSRGSRRSPEVVEADAESSKASRAEEAAEWVKALVEILEAVLPKLRTVSDALTAASSASPDPGSECLCLALAVSELGQKLRRLEESPILQGPQGPPPIPVLRFFHRGPFLGPATADILWGLVARQKLLLLDNWVLEKSRGWQMMRATGVGWWGSPALLDQIVTRLAQASMAKLRSGSSHSLAATVSKHSRPQSSADDRTFDAGVWGRAPEEQEQVARKLAVDEAVFWSVVLGASCGKLRALCKTGLFREAAEAGAGGQLWTLLSHERANEPLFLRKNAFRLLELHRFHLAAALFLLAGSCEEALQIISRHLKDLQLCVLVARDPKHREALQKVLQRTEQAEAEDLWLRRLLAYHSRAGWGAAEPEKPEEPEERATRRAAADFDGLRLSHRSAALPEVERRIREEL
ncbi:DMXL2 [Symbiodinium sp. CCMP2592]|nr:DMXL2 [Symbiodinium sp. CCMP2592]